VNRGRRQFVERPSPSKKEGDTEGGGGGKWDRGKVGKKGSAGRLSGGDDLPHKTRRRNSSVPGKGTTSPKEKNVEKVILGEKGHGLTKISPTKDHLAETGAYRDAW